MTICPNWWWKCLRTNRSRSGWNEFLLEFVPISLVRYGFCCAHSIHSYDSHAKFDVANVKYVVALRHKTAYCRYCIRYNIAETLWARNAIVVSNTENSTVASRHSQVDRSLELYLFTRERELRGERIAIKMPWIRSQTERPPQILFQFHAISCSSINRQSE